VTSPAFFTCDAILFDMDGTLIDSTAVVERQWRRWARGHGLDPAPFIARAHGRRTIDTLRELAPRFATEEEAAAFDEEEAADSVGVVPVPGAGALLSLLPAGRWALVTSATKALARGRMAAAALPMPEVVVTAEDVERGKPDPAGFLLAARQMGASTSRCLVFEDTPAGIEAGRAAGMTVIAIATTYPAIVLQAARVLPDLRGVVGTGATRGIELWLPPAD
jgi:sugar-phosphatase